MLSVSVTDKDEGISGVFTCTFQEPSELFEIDPNSCDITLKSELNYTSLAVTNFSLTIVASDFGMPSLSDAVNINIAIVPAIVQELELQANYTDIIYTEERGPVTVLNEFELIQGTHNRPIYVATIDLTPRNATTPEHFSTHCKTGGNRVTLSECFPGFTSCLPDDSGEVATFSAGSELPAVSVSIPHGSQVLVFQTWLKTAHNQSESIVLLSGYSTTSDIDDTVFHISINNLSIVVSIGNVSISGRSLHLTDNTWHHIFVIITPMAIHLYVDGKQPVSFESTPLTFSSTIHLYVGRLKVGNYPKPFIGSIWGPSVSFSEPNREYIPGYLFCIMSCGEILFTREFDEETVIMVSPNKLEMRTQSFESLTNALSGLSYNNTASEPTAHVREVFILLSDGKYVANVTVTIHTVLVNEHAAVMDLRVELTGNVFFYVEPSVGPFSTRTTPSAFFSDEDTSQTDYRLRIDIIPPPQRLCDRLDYAVKVKLQECGSTPSIVMNLLPDYQWGLGTVIEVQSFYDYFLGYRFYGSGVFIPDVSFYQNTSINAHHFTFVSWLKLDGMGTVVHVVDNVQPFLFWLRVNDTMLETVHSFQEGQTHILSPVIGSM